MLAVKKLPPLKQILAKKQSLSAEQAFELKKIIRPLVIWQEHPPLALQAISGIVVPPHQRIMHYAAHLGAVYNVFIGSRGTSKTSTIDVNYSTYKNLLFGKRQGITLSASGFRGGQVLFSDLEKWVLGGWVDQEAGLDFLKNSIKNDKLIHRAQNFWKIDFTSLSGNMTVPTNDSEKLRGLRGTELYVDEANFTDFELIDKVAESFLNVLQDFATGGENAQANVVYYTTTVDYAWRDFQRTARGAYEGLRRELEYLKAVGRGEKDTARALAEKGMHDTMYVCLDYTDTIMRRYVTNRKGQRFEVVWPDKRRSWRLDPQGIPYTVRAENGRMKMEGTPVEVITTYPINRKMEGKVLRGETTEPIWLAEQRNVVDSSAGDVYPHALVDHAANKGGRYLLHWDDCGEKYQRFYRDPERHYVPQVLYECSDPCVLGVDYAPGSRDFSAFVVIRIGPMAEGEFDPITGLGKTKWSNIIWAEQHRNASGANVAEKIRAFAERYNLVYFHDPYETDTWKLCRAIGLDVRGGGNAVRDELVLINDEQVPEGKYRILDPLDDDPRLAAFKTDANAKPMLDAIKPTSQLNDKLVEFTVGQFTQRLLYLPADVPLQERGDAKNDIAYDGARILEHQLRAIQQAPTATGYRKFFVPGDAEAVTNKKDFWAAFIYASKQLRAHLLRIRLTEDAPPPLGAAVTRLAGGKNYRNAPGARSWY